MPAARTIAVIAGWSAWVAGRIWKVMDAPSSGAQAASGVVSAAATSGRERVLDEDAAELLQPDLHQLRLIRGDQGDEGRAAGVQMLAQLAQRAVGEARVLQP